MTAKIFHTSQRDALLTTMGEYQDMIAAVTAARKRTEED